MTQKNIFCYLLIFVFCLTLSCSGTQKKKEAVVKGDNTEVSGSAGTKEKIEPAPQTPKDAPAIFRFNEKAEAFYATENDPARLANRVRAIFSQFAAQKHKKPELSVALSLLAKEILRYKELYKQSPPENLLETLRLRFGVASPGFEILILDDSQKALKELENQYEKEAFNTVGISVSNPATNSEKICLVLQKKPLKLNPFAKVVPFEHRFRLSGKCLTDSCGLTAELMLFNETVFKTVLQSRNGRFDSEIQIPSAKADYVLQISNNQKGHNAVLAKVIIYSTPRDIDSYDPLQKNEGCFDDKLCENQLTELINKYRVENSLVPLIVSPTLKDIAKSHSKDMSLNNYISLFDRNGKSLMHWLAENNFQTLQSAEIVEGGNSVENILAGLKSDKTYDTYLKNPYLTNIGCGVSSKLSKLKDRSYSAASCVLVTVIDERKGETLKKAIFNRINKLKIKAGTTPFKNADYFQDLADVSLERLIENPKQAKEVQEDVKLELESSSMSIKDSVFGVFTIFTVDQLQYNPTVNMLVKSERQDLVISVTKLLDPNKEMKGIFIYYIAYR